MVHKPWRIIPRPLLETVLNNHSQHHRVPQPLILHGPRGAGKTTLILERTVSNVDFLLILFRIVRLMIPDASQVFSPIGTRVRTYLDTWILLKPLKIITQFMASRFRGRRGRIVRHRRCLIAELNWKVASNRWLKRVLN